MQALLLLASVWGYPSLGTFPLLAGSLPAVTHLTAVDSALKKAWSGWKDSESLRVSYSVSVKLLRRDPAANEERLPPDYQARTPIPFWRTEFARKGEKRYCSFTASPISTPKEKDRNFVVAIYDGQRGWTIRPALRGAYLANGPVPQSLPQAEIYGDVIGIGSVALLKQRTFKENLPYPFRLDELLVTGAYKVLDEHALIGDVACVLIERAGLDRIWLDPQRGYGAVQREWHWDLGESLKVKINNSQFRQVLDGLWLPTRSRVEYYGTPQTAPGELCAVAELSVSELELNISDEIFVPKLKARTLVQDVDRQVAWATSEEITPATFEQVIASSEKLIRTERRRGPWLLLIVGLSVVLLAGLAGAVLWWRRRAPAKRPRT